MKCPVCKQTIKDNSKFCSKCGCIIPRCPSCGNVIEKKMNFCVHDGTPLSEEILAAFQDGDDSVDNNQSREKYDYKHNGKGRSKKIRFIIIVLIVFLIGVGSLFMYAYISGEFPWESHDDKKDVEEVISQEDLAYNSGEDEKLYNNGNKNIDESKTTYEDESMGDNPSETMDFKQLDDDELVLEEPISSENNVDDDVNEDEDNEDNDSQSVEYGTAFWGIWCMASKNYSEAAAVEESLLAKGFDARVFVSSDWSNLNTEKWYVVSCGIYASEEEAKAHLDEVLVEYSDAYIKYSGDHR